VTGNVLHYNFLDCSFRLVLIDLVGDLFDFFDSTLETTLSETSLTLGINGDPDIPSLSGPKRA
jgi:hypothetical protein